MAKALAVFAIAIQVMMPAAMAQPGHDGISRYFCAESGTTLSTEAINAFMRDLAPFLDDGESKTFQTGMSHCPICALTDIATLADSVSFKQIIADQNNKNSVRYSATLLASIKCLPLGSRAPPASL